MSDIISRVKAAILKVNGNPDAMAVAAVQACRPWLTEEGLAELRFNDYQFSIPAEMWRAILAGERP